MGQDLTFLLAGALLMFFGVIVGQQLTRPSGGSQPDDSGQQQATTQVFPEPPDPAKKLDSYL